MNSRETRAKYLSFFALLHHFTLIIQINILKASIISFYALTSGCAVQRKTETCKKTGDQVRIGLGVEEALSLKNRIELLGCHRGLGSSFGANSLVLQSLPLQL